RPGYPGRDRGGDTGCGRHLMHGMPIGDFQSEELGSPADEGLRCPECGYNLTGLSAGTCPECGRKFDPAVLRKMRLIGYGPIPIWDERGRRGLLSAYLA